jgi:hypothetical protein
MITCKILKANNFNRKIIIIIFICLLFLTLTYLLSYKKLNQIKSKKISTTINSFIEWSSSQKNEIKTHNKTKDIRIFCMILSNKNSLLNNKVRNLYCFLYRNYKFVANRQL